MSFLALLTEFLSGLICLWIAAESMQTHEIEYIFTLTTTKQIAASFHRSLEVWDFKEEWFFWRQVEGVAGLRGAAKGMSKQTLGPEWWDRGNGNRTPHPCSHVNTAMWITAVRMPEDPGDNRRQLSARSICDLCFYKICKLWNHQYVGQHRLRFFQPFEMF